MWIKVTENELNMYKTVSIGKTTENDLIVGKMVWKG